MKIQIQVKPNSKKESVEKLSSGIYRVSVHAPPQEGKANEGVLELLANFFQIPKSSIKIRSGLRSKIKLVEIPG